MSTSRTYAIEDIFGALLLIAGLFALGLFNFKSDAPLVEAGLSAQARNIVSESVHGMQVSIDGRHITLSGLADSEAEKTEILEALRGIEGRGKIRTRVKVLETVTPFVFAVSREADLPFRFEGATPTEAFRKRLTETYGDGTEELTLASGSPDAEWATAAEKGLRALAELTAGRLTIEDRVLRLSGEALTPEVAARAELLLGDLPEGYVVTTRIAALDDGTPLRLTATRADGKTQDVSGKLPVSMKASSIGGQITYSPLPLPMDRWDEAVSQGLTALNALHNGHLTIIGRNLTLTGEAWSDASYGTALAALEKLPGELAVSNRITLADSGAPFGLVLSREGHAVRAEGKVPQSLAPRVLAALVDEPVNTEALEVARVSPGDEWWQAASLAAQAVRRLKQGQVRFDGSTLTLEGRVQDPAALRALEQQLDSLPEAVTLDLQIALIDDGTPLRLHLSSDGANGLLSGKLPDGWRADTLAEWLGQPVLAGDFVHTPKPGPENWAEAAHVGVQALALFESGVLELAGEDMALRGVLRSPAREKQVLNTLAALPGGYSFATEISFQDDGRPFGFRLKFDGARGVLSGKVPSDLGPASQSAILGAPIAAEGLSYAGVPADADWWGAARAGVKALSELQDGELRLDAHQMRLTGRAETTDIVEAVRSRLAPYQQDFKITVEISAE